MGPHLLHKTDLRKAA